MPAAHLNSVALPTQPQTQMPAVPAICSKATERGADEEDAISTSCETDASDDIAVSALEEGSGKKPSSSRIDQPSSDWNFDTPLDTSLEWRLMRTMVRASRHFDRETAATVP